MEELYSPIHRERIKYRSKLPHVLHNLHNLVLREQAVKNFEVLSIFPHTFDQGFLTITSSTESFKSSPLSVGVVFSGGPAAGGHNVIAGLYDALKKLHSENTLWGFIGGPQGVIENKKKELTASLIDNYRNMGGFDLIQTGRTKIEKEEQFEAVRKTVQDSSLDALVVIGGDDSNTNAALLAEYFLKHSMKTQVIGVPKTIDGDLRHEKLQISFGFDTATKVYSELIGNIARDCLSAKKYYHFIKLMGRSASHITLECALATHPNVALIGEEIADKKMTLSDVISSITDVICKRAINGKQYGLILIPEGLIEFIPEMRLLISELNKLLAAGKVESVRSHLSENSRKTFEYLPVNIQEQLLLERDPHGNVQVSHIATDQLILELVKKALKGRSDYKGIFTAVSHFFGYEGRCALPSNFDADYCYAIGHVAAVLIDRGYTGYMATIFNLGAGIDKWESGGISLTSMLHQEERNGKKVPVIKKALVELDQTPFKLFARLRNSWDVNDHYRYPGPIQFWGNANIVDSLPRTITL